MDNDTKKVFLEKAENGMGNTVRATYSFIQTYRNDFELGTVPVYRVVKSAEGNMQAELVNISFLYSLSPEQFENENFIVSKNWKEQISSSNSDPFSAKVQDYLSLKPEERTKEVIAIRKTLEEMKNSDAHPMSKAKAIMDSVEQTFLLNKASLKMNRAEVTVNERMVANETQAVVNAALGMVGDVETSAMLFEAFKSLSNGQTLNHIGRVFGMMASFMHYYNSLFQQRIAQSIRLVFPSSYLDTYHSILPGLADHLFVSDNMVPLPLIDPPAMKEYALGAFLHDMGKIANLDYFESNAEYNMKEIRQHVFISSGLILMNYGVDHEKARLMAGDHHNGLFSKGGYGVTRLEREKGIRKLAEVERCIATSADDFMSGRALGFLPTEMLAIVDIYDAMTDSSRIYKKAMTPTDAIVFLLQKPVTNGTLDPVLVDIFIDFIRVQHPEIPEQLGIAWKISQPR